MEIDGLDNLINNLDQAINGGFKEQLGLWLEAMGMEFLDLIQDEIIRTKTVDTRALLNSFQKGDRENMWSISSGGLTLDIGTNLHYASFVNDGHFIIDPSKGLDRRWVPGYWQGDRFVYSPGHDGGMLLKQQWIDGTGYWDNALAIFDRMFEKALDRKLQEWLDSLF
ncbi:HK97 gp10 family phage protein [Ornithinibacillus sp. 4-3]|uniref:HK97 gp10 family phage protein n=1 Tax=Ornithinibacillus sp. 4-3 TaxID=3231488 RepID=A0AB39HR79_9BACI